MPYLLNFKMYKKGLHPEIKYEALGDRRLLQLWL